MIYKFLTELPRFEIRHETSKAKVVSPCFHLYYSNHPFRKRMQRFSKTPLSCLKECEDYNHKIPKIRMEPPRRRESEKRGPRSLDRRAPFVTKNCFASTQVIVIVCNH